MYLMYLGEYNPSAEEKQFIELRKKYVDELLSIEKQIEELNFRHAILTRMLEGTVDFDEEETSSDESMPTLSHEDIDARLIDFVKRDSVGVGKHEIIQELVGSNIPEEEIRRSLDRCRRRGLIINKGRGRGSLWYPIKNVKK